MSGLFAQAAAVGSEAAGKLSGSYIIDVAVFFGFLLLVMFTAFSVSRKSGSDSESYFLAGRGLSWWLIGFSLIAANISAEQFIGMSGNASDYIGLAVASYEWIAALSLVIVAFIFLPKFLKAGVYTIPEYLQQRYSKSARTVMSLMMVVMLVAVNFTAVTYAGAKYFAVLFADTHFTIGSGAGTFFEGNPLNLYTFCWFIGILAAAYVFAGGLKACAWSDLLQGTALIAGGAIVLYFALNKLGSADPAALTPAVGTATDSLQNLAQSGSWDRFNALNAEKLRMNLPAKDTFLPITALLFAIWIPNLYYWGLNQYIIQRTLGSKSLGEGQKGLIFAAVMKLVIPFIIVFPGMMAFNLYHSDMKASARQNASGELTRLDQIKAGAADAAASSMLFSFNKEFALHNNDAAQSMLETNARIAGVELPPATATDGTELSMAERQSALKKAIAEKAKTDPEVKNLKYGTSIADCDYDSAFPLLVKKLIPLGGFKGFLFAALLGAIISSVAAMLNAASTIFTMDIYKEYLHRHASQKMLVFVGRITVLLFVVVGCWIAPKLADPKFEGIFKFIQEFQGYISPGILAVFAFGFLFSRAPSICGVLGLLLCPAIYGALHLYVPQLDFLNRMAVTFCAIIGVLTLVTLIKPRPEPYRAEAKTTLDLTGSKLAKVIGVLVVLATLALYVYFWDSSTPMFGK